MHSVSKAPRRLISPVAIMAAGLVAVLLAACSSTTKEQAPATPQTATVALADAKILADPKSHVGPSTAVLANTAMVPIATNPVAKLPVTITDTQGTKVTVTDTSRILALDLYGSLSRLVYDLGFGANLVGRDISSSYDEVKDLPLVTSNGHQLNGEAILALSPTVIFTDSSIGPWDVILQMRDAGIPVVVMDSKRDISSIGSMTQGVADALGVPDLGKKLSKRTQSEVDAKVAEIAKIAPTSDDRKLRMVFLYMRGGAGVYYMFGEESGADSLIKALGGYDVAGEIGWSGMKPITDEALIDAQPDLILTMAGGIESVGGIDGLLKQLPAVAQTPAGKNRRIVDMNDNEILSFGPQTADVLDALASAIYAPGGGS